MKSENTFQNEFNWLKVNLPEALLFEESKSPEEFFTQYFLDLQNNTITKYLAEYFHSTRQLFQEDTIQIHPLEIEFEDWIWPKESIELIHNQDLDSIHTNIDYYLEKNSFSQKQIKELVVNFGTHAFGTYLPMHEFFINTKTPWGIYLFPETIAGRALYLKEKYKEYPIKNWFRFYLYCIYRHELFHFQTERFATKMEILLRQKKYLEYDKEIYWKNAYTSNWLEEALAEKAVLESRLVLNRTKIPAKILKNVYKEDLKEMPAGYRDYDCKTYGGYEIAHCHLVSHILHLNNVSPIPTNLHTIQQEYITDDKKVPVYLVYGLNNLIKQIQ